MEIELMKRISECSNPHIINMIGAVTTMEPMLLVIEFMKYGDLQSYLKACRKGVGKLHLDWSELLDETD